MLSSSLAVGVAISLLLTQLTALSAGGIVTPGYLGFILDRPVEVLLVLGLSVAVWGAIRLLGDGLMLYGAKRFGMTILVSLVLASGTRAVLAEWDSLSVDESGLGYVVPGLVAHQIDRQGLLVTFLMLAIAIPLVRTILLVMRMAA
jgi:poly-gamma-glutamate biosynthesis protein PgsC/CapC